MANENERMREQEREKPMPLELEANPAESKNSFGAKVGEEGGWQMD
jgi:hypothetical protein